MAAEGYDILIIGAGLAGINAAYRIQSQLPAARYAILETRPRLGGTWDFWKYPGLRTDSSMTLYRFPWRPWSGSTLVDANQLVDYMKQAANQEGIDKKIVFEHRVVRMEYSSSTQRWTVTVSVNGTMKTLTASWLISCMGYYDYEKPLPADIRGLDAFQGEVIHAQTWKDGAKWANERVVIIGSGATTITLLPKLAENAKHVTMLQRSPAYTVSIDSVSSIEKNLRRWLPALFAMWLLRLINIVQEALLVRAGKHNAVELRSTLMEAMRQQLPARINVNEHFNPSYLPVQQRVAVCPDGDFFRAFHRRNVDIVTDKIDTVTATGIRTANGVFIEADMIVTATGLNVQLWGGLEPIVDGKPVKVGERYVWRSCMLDGVPNAGFVTGYIAGTWTLGVDIGTRNIIRVMKHCQKTGASAAVPTLGPQIDRTKLPRTRMLKNQSTYMKAAQERLPMSADVGPWYKATTYVSDTWRAMFSNVTDGMDYVIV